MRDERRTPHDGHQHIAISHSSYSGDLKKSNIKHVCMYVYMVNNCMISSMSETQKGTTGTSSFQGKCDEGSYRYIIIITYNF